MLREYLCVAAQLGMAAILLLCSAACPALADDAATIPPPEVRSTETTWPLFRGDSYATGVAASTLPDQLELLWRFEVPQGAFEATAVIFNDTVFIGDLDGTLFALNLSDGTKVWEYKTKSGFPASPAYANGRIIVGDYDGNLHCVDAKNGEKQWIFTAGAEISSSVNIHGEQILFGSQDATLYCLNQNDGSLVWQRTLPDQIRCLPTIAGGKCFVAGCDGSLHIINITDGEESGSVPINAPTGVTPAVLGNMVYFGTEAGEIFGVNWQEPKAVWTHSDERGGQPIRSSAAVRDGLVVIGSRNKKILALDAQTGDEKWTFATRVRVDSAPVIVGERVFVGTANGRLYAFKLSNGEKLWEYEAGGGFTGSPAVASRRLVIANDRGVVYCFGKATP